MVRIFLKYCLAAMVVIAVGACGKDPEVAKREFMRTGQQYAASGKLKEAIIEYRNAVQQDPRFGEARFALAGVLLKTGDNQGAYGEYQRAADLLHNDANAQMWAGEMNLVAGLFDDARSHADKALAIDAKSVRAQLLKANALAGLKQLDAAVEQAQGAAGLDSGTRAFRNLAVLQYAKGDNASAEKTFKRIVDTEPKAMDARVALANFYWSTGRRDVAETVLREALAADPKSLVVNRALASLYISSERLAEAEQPLKLVADEAKDPDSRIALADYYRATRRSKEALDLLGQVAADPKGFSIATARKGALLYAEGRKAEAYAALDAVLQKEETDTTALVLKSQFLAQDGKLDEGLAAAQKAVAANPGAPSARYAIGRIQEAMGHNQEGIAAYNEVLKVFPGSLDSQLGLARLYLTSGRADDALHFAQQVLGVQPANEIALVVEARAQMSKRNVAAAERPVKTLEAIAPGSSRVQATLGMFYTLKGDVRNGRASYEKALVTDPFNADALGGLAVLDIADKKPEAARARFDAALAKQPDSVPLLAAAARAYTAMKDYPRAEKTLKRIVKLDPANAVASAQLGEVYMAQNRTDEALSEFEAMARRDPKSVVAHTMAGMLLGAQHKRDAAKKHYEDALSVDERAPVAANNLAWMYVEDGGNLDVALQLAQAAKSAAPDSGDVDDTLGVIYLKKGLMTQALAALKGSVEKNPTNPTFKYHLGLAYAKNGDAASARQTLETALKLDPNSTDATEARATLAKLGS
jgi:tetratricopeptide (TPR) repeat protein